MLKNNWSGRASYSAGQLTSLTDWLNQTVSYGYDAAGQQTSVDRPNGVSTTTTYDAAGQISSIDHHDANGTLQSFSYAYDDAGNRISVLTAAGTESYTFDLLNRLTQTVNGVATNYTYDNADQLTDVNGTSYSYDANGNRTAATTSGVTTTYGYDARNQLSSLTGPTNASFTYDGAGERVSKTVGGTTTDYGYDGSGNQVSRTSNGTTTTNLWDGASPLAQLVDDGSTSYVQANGVPVAGFTSGGNPIYPIQGRSGSGVPSLQDLSQAAAKPYQGGPISEAGRALQKHGGRTGSAFPKPTGSPDAINRQAQQIVDDILYNPSTTFQVYQRPGFGAVIDVIAPDGRGIRYLQNGEFIGFLEPNR